MKTDFVQDRRDGDSRGDIIFALFGHATIGIEWDGKHIYLDPCLSEADYSLLPKADAILITHHHDDHFDPKAIELLRQSDTVIIANEVVGRQVEGAEILGGSNRTFVNSWMTVEAVPAYNIERTQFHPKERGDNGYIVEVAGRRIYIGGDTELTPEMRAAEDIDYLFLPVNLPYTMTVEMAVEAARTIRPSVFYPFHTVGTAPEDIARIPELLEGDNIEVVIAPME
jgi:L-ascorbate metabolism protein UlaG (beta-lactamase superfamily)